MKQAITLRVPIDTDWDAGDRLQVYSDFGSGTIDSTNPLVVRGLDMFPGQQEARGVGRRPVGIGRVGDAKAARRGRGIGRSRLGVTPVGTAPPFVLVTVDVPPAFGLWKFAVEVVDAEGNVQSGARQEITAIVSGTEPAPLKSFTFDSYDDQADQVTFDFLKNTE